jgi:uncharacterized protein (DUF488 family)
MSFLTLHQVTNDTVYTIGHSTRTLEAFISLLQENRVQLLIDVRHYPGSRKYPHFNKEELQRSLEEAGIRYRHFVALGGRRKPGAGSKNTAWRHPAFRGYADHMETDEFVLAASELETLARAWRCAYMCSEAVWWRCHRSLISDYLKARGWNVLHIMAPNKLAEHPYTSAASVVDGRLSYKGE